MSPRPGLMHTVFSVGSFWRPRTRQPRHTKRARCTQSSAVTQHGTAATRARGLREQAPGRGPATTRPGSAVTRILYPETRSLVAGPGDSRRGTAAFGYRAGKNNHPAAGQAVLTRTRTSALPVTRNGVGRRAKSLGDSDPRSQDWTAAEFLTEGLELGGQLARQGPGPGASRGQSSAVAEAIRAGG